jgi:hypothetical protein
MLQSTQSLLTPGGDSQGRQNLIRIAGALREFQEETGIHPSKLRVEYLAFGRNIHRVKLQVILSQILSRRIHRRRERQPQDQTFDERRPSGRICDTDAPLPLPRIRISAIRSIQTGLVFIQDCLNDPDLYNWKLRVINTVREITKTFDFNHLHRTAAFINL